MDDKVYLYDGSFINLLNLIIKLIDNKVKPLDIKDEFNYEYNLVDKTFKMNIDNDGEVINLIINKISYYAFKMAYYVFLSDDMNKELIIYYFLLNGFIHGDKVIYLRNLKCVRSALKISRYVGRENHRLKGFVRFKDYNNFLYAEIEPTNNVLCLLSEHFSKRLSSEHWIINDTKRKLMSVYQNNEFHIIEANNFNINDFELSNSENDYESLWKTFFSTIAIKERTNKRCQMNLMPKKYWKHILEMEDRE